MPVDQKTENEKKKEYLWRYQNAKRKEAEINEEIMQLRIDKMVPSLVQDGMPHGSGGGDLSGYAARLDELMRELYEQMEKKITIRLEISRKIEEMQDETESLLLRYRYIQGLNFEEIAVKMGYGYRHITRLHGWALQHFEM